MRRGKFRTTDCSRLKEISVLLGEKHASSVGELHIGCVVPCATSKCLRSFSPEDDPNGGAKILLLPRVSWQSGVRAPLHVVWRGVVHEALRSYLASDQGSMRQGLLCHPLFSPVGRPKRDRGNRRACGVSRAMPKAGSRRVVTN